MSRRVRFAKWEGLGNDFVVIEGPEGMISPEQALRLCDRRRGIGADGVLLVGRDGPMPTMIVLNADGSRPEMCGNGLRCVAAHLVAASEPTDGAPLAEPRTLSIATDSGPKPCLVRSVSPGLFEVGVDMGQVALGGELAVEVDGREHRFSIADMGNPHAVSFEPFDEELVERVGPVASRMPPAGYNVELCRVEPSGAGRVRVVVVVWERGVGRTQACGTGACAVAAVACATGRASFGEPVTVGLPGGDLEITVSAAWAVRMRGAARRVFEGEVELE